MARREDPDVRRRQIAEAVLAIAAREGLEAATVRDVAAEAGVSAGMVQHHFRSRDDMLLFTCRYMVQRTGERIAGRVAQLPEPRQPHALLRQIFEEMLPLDEERRTGIRVWIAFLARAVVREELGDYMRETHQGTHAMITGMLRQAEAAGTLALGVDPEREAIALFSQVDGLVSHVLLDHYTGDEALRTIDDHLDRVFRR